jgi:hypothetical protein
MYWRAFLFLSPDQEQAPHGENRMRGFCYSSAKAFSIDLIESAGVTTAIGGLRMVPIGARMSHLRTFSVV